MKKNFIIIGLGPHAQSCQYEFLEHQFNKGREITVSLLADLQDKNKDIDNYLKDKNLQPQQIIGLPESDRNSPEINHNLLNFLEQIKKSVDGVIICTEPKAHKKYILWALQNNIDVLADKPLTAPIINETGPAQIWQDYLEIEQALKKSKAHITLMTNKRLHDAYGKLYKNVEDFVSEFSVPITYIEVSEGGGIWNLPSEFNYKENHPYKYGYGILLHTGFHYVDLLLHYQQINHQIGFKEDDIKLHAFGSTPYDFIKQLPQTAYERLFDGENFSKEFQQLPLDKYKYYGITDLLCSMQFMHKGAVITQASLNLIQNSLSARASRPYPQNPYLDSGRLTHNYIAIYCGPLFCAYLTYRQPDFLEDEESDFYSIDIFRNTEMIGGEAHTNILFEDMFTQDNKYFSLNKKAKFNLMTKWLEGKCPECDFYNYRTGIKITSGLFEEIFKRRKERFS